VCAFLFLFWRDFVTVICVEQIFNSSASFLFLFYPSSLFLGISWLESFLDGILKWSSLC